MEKCFRIALVTYSLNYGGVGTYIISMAREFKKRGWYVEVITTEKKGAWYQKLQQEGIDSSSVNFGILAFLPFGRIIQGYRVGKLLQKKSFDVVFINHSIFAQAAIGFYKPPARVFTVIHNQITPVVKASGLNHQNVDKIICVSPQACVEAKKYVPSEKLSIIYNGIKIPDDVLLQNRSGFSSPLKLVFAGRLENNQKGIFLIPEILKNLKRQKIDFELSILGEGPDKQELYRKLEAVNLIENVCFKGLLEQAEVYSVYLGSHILLMPSNFEGLPLTLIEAMSCGCVPVVSYLPGSTDICVENFKSGYLVRPGVAEDFVEKVKALSEPSVWSSFSKRSIEITREKFSLERMMEEYINLFNKNENCIGQPVKINFGKDWWKESIPYFLIMKVKKTVKKLRK